MGIRRLRKSIENEFVDAFDLFHLVQQPCRTGHAPGVTPVNVQGLRSEGDFTVQTRGTSSALQRGEESVCKPVVFLYKFLNGL